MKFSIITCTYNSVSFIRENIFSVESQTFQDYEHIFIDGFSDDGSIRIIEEYKKRNPNKVKIFQYKPRGIANAMNMGINNSSGDYLIHLHADDTFYDNKVLRDVNELLIKKNPDMLYGKANFVNLIKKKNKIIPHRKIYYKMRFWLLLLTNYIPHQSVFIKKEVFDKFGLFQEKYKNSMDYEMWLRLSKNKIRSTFINRIICNFLIHENSQSTTKKNNNDHTLIHNCYVDNKFLKNILFLIDKINKKRIS